VVDNFFREGFCLGDVDSADVRRRIVEYLKNVGRASVYQIARALGISYGAAQWHLYVLERDGVIFTVVMGRKRVAMLRDSLDVYLATLKMTDFFRDLWTFLRARGIDGNTPFLQTLDIIGEERREVALALMSIAKNLYQEQKEEHREKSL
jgi:DNA-binding transcriptional ArsR family regulator